jgi:hypothetical protein
MADPIILPQLPGVLYYLRIEATQIRKGGERRILNLLKYPQPGDTTDDIVSDITTAWNLWWEQSEWFMQSSTGRPKWNSAARTGQIWTLFGEVVLYPTGRPHVFCLRCGCALQHPSIGLIGTKHLSNHVDTRMCKSIPIPIYT